MGKGNKTSPLSLAPLKMKRVLNLALFTILSCQPNPQQDVKDAEKSPSSLQQSTTEPSTKESRKSFAPTLAKKSTSKALSDNQNYLKTRKELSPYSFTSEIRSLKDIDQKLPFHLNEKYAPLYPDFALLDFNKDGHLDLFFEYYGLSGSGEKNCIDIYFFEPSLNKFADSCMTLVNPSYFYNDDIISSYYYGLGGGQAHKYQIKNGRLDLIESIEIDIQPSDSFQVFFRYSKKPFTDTLIFTDNQVRLPEEYQYRRIIKKSLNQD